MGNIHNRTSLGVQPLFTEDTTQSGILSSALGAIGHPPTPKPRSANPPNHMARAARLGTAWRTEEDRQHRFTAHTNLYKVTLHV